MTEKLKLLPKGLYRLTRDVQNPRPDRRLNTSLHRDWPHAPVWKRGTIFRVDQYPNAHTGIGATWSEGRIAWAQGGYAGVTGYDHSEPEAHNNAAYALLAEALEPYTPQTVSSLEGCATTPQLASVLLALLRLGVVSMDPVREMLIDIRETDNLAYPDEEEVSK